MQSYGKMDFINDPIDQNMVKVHMGLLTSNYQQKLVSMKLKPLETVETLSYKDNVLFYRPGFVKTQTVDQLVETINNLIGE